jgi:hypothetical protein
MDRNSPVNYVQSTEENIRDTEAVISHVQGLQSPLVKPVITPRFIPTCSPQLLQGKWALHGPLNAGSPTAAKMKGQHLELGVGLRSLIGAAKLGCGRRGLQRDALQYGPWCSVLCVLGVCVAGLGALAAAHPGILIHSHISESHDAVAATAELHPEAGGRDAQLFDAAGLLTDRVRFMKLEAPHCEQYTC